MSKYTLNVPTSGWCPDWFGFVNDSLNRLKDGVRYNKLIVDFNEVLTLETDDIVVLACLIESFYSEDCRVHFTGGGSELNKYLDNIRFKEYWEEDFDREKFTFSQNKTTLCLWKISKDMISQYTDYANTYFRDIFVKGKDLLPLASNLEEVFNNIFDHSGSKIAYVITQYFPDENKLSFSVCDFGIGIPKSINNFNQKNCKELIEDGSALKLSLKNGFSVKSSLRNRGLGLDNIREFMDSSNGTLRILSNNGSLEREAGRDNLTSDTNYNFKGTLIRVEVDTRTFDAIDEDDLLFRF